MTDTLTLFDVADVPTLPGEPTIEERFEAFHTANPWVYDALVHLARQEVHEVGGKVAIDYLFNVLRWHHRRQTHGDTFRLNNNFRSRYARRIMAHEPDLNGVFETRELKAA